MGTQHNLAEYAFAREVIKHFPILIIELNRTLKILRTCSSFAAAQHSIQAIDESLEMLNNQYAYYKKVLDKKGSK